MEQEKEHKQRLKTRKARRTEEKEKRESCTLNRWLKSVCPSSFRVVPVPGHTLNRSLGCVVQSSWSLNACFDSKSHRHAHSKLHRLVCSRLVVAISQQQITTNSYGPILVDQQRNLHHCHVVFSFVNDLNAHLD